MHPVAKNARRSVRDPIRRLEALVLLNDHTMVEAAVAMAAKSAESTDDDTARLNDAFRLATSRSPDPTEMNSLQSLLNRETNALRSKCWRCRIARSGTEHDAIDGSTPVELGGLDRRDTSDPELV